MEEIMYNSLTYLIVIVAIAIAAKKILQKNTKESESSCGDGCGGCASKCDLKQLVKKTEINQ